MKDFEKQNLTFVLRINLFLGFFFNSLTIFENSNHTKVKTTKGEGIGTLGWD
jgi:hypothetical protein